MTDDRKKRIAELRRAGYGYANIASSLGLTKNQVASYCNRNGLAGEKAMREEPDNGRCKYCGKPLRQTLGRKTVKFCSDDCCQKWWTSHPEAVKRRAVYSFTCAHCGKQFTAYGNSKRKYCSRACYIADRFGGKARD